MPCLHCNNLRRGQGGIELGGRVALEMIACPCTHYPKLPIGEDAELLNQAFTFHGSGFWTYIANLRICPQAAQVVRPSVIDFVITNGGPVDFSWEVLLEVFEGYEPTCTTINPFDPVGFNQTIDGVPITVEDFATPTVSGTFLYVRIRVFLIETTPFPDTPIFTLTYNFSPPP